MIIKNMFSKPIDRDIKGVIKVGQDDDANIKQELEEYVVTRELQKHFSDFFASYKRGIIGNTDKMGVWISGFFGSGKSHFLKILSYLLENKEVGGKKAIDYFVDDNKISDQMVLADPNLDALIPAGGGGDPLQGAIAAVERAGKTDSIDIVSTDFLPDLGERLENGSMAGESGGHFCDPLISFMMVYNAIKGDYADFGGKFEDVPFPYLYVSSPEDYKAYEEYFVDQLPYTDEELVEMSKLSLDDLKATAAKVSIEDAAERAGK